MLEIPSAPGNLGKVTTASCLAGGDIGEVETVKVGANYTIRNMTVQVEHEEQHTEILEMSRTLKEGIHLHNV
ncbi:NAD-dependent malic enzyme, partial [Bacillus paralicheniformis]|nr:NAD-dependent malic enzyme [Bacillus paralicheniformis]